MSFSFLSDLQTDQPKQRPFVQTSSTPESSYWEKTGRPQFENGPGANYPQLTEGIPSQLSGSKMFTPLDNNNNAPPPQYQPQQHIQQLQQHNLQLRQQLNNVSQYLQHQKQQTASSGGTGKKTTD